MRREGWVETTGRTAAFAGILGVALVAALGAVGGCQKADPAAPLKERAAAYWGLKQSKAWPEVYDKYVDPEAKKSLSREAFLKRRFLAFDILSYEISDVKQEGEDKGAVAVTNEVNFPLKTPEGELTFIKKRVTTTDQWVRRDGVWYVVMTE
ncbi:MAG: hypothetical protein IT294_02060 [Deltaproteobacteria bacterium]|nr:hypothetical protein [Deltaproteobacteria bacterium]